MNIRITRQRISYHYKRFPDALPGWDNNDANNGLDKLELFDADNRLILTSKAQTVANLEGLNANVHFSDTIAPGLFFLRAFVSPRMYKCMPHGIANAETMAGDKIDADSVTQYNKLRWLMHDWRNFTGKETRVAWSAGCIVLPVASLDRFNALLVNGGIRAGALIPVELVEVA